MNAFALMPFQFQQMPKNVLHEDVSGGQEDYPVSVVNEYSRDTLPKFTYIRNLRVSADAVGSLVRNDEVSRRQKSRVSGCKR